MKLHLLGITEDERDVLVSMYQAKISDAESEIHKLNLEIFDYQSRLNDLRDAEIGSYPNSARDDHFDFPYLTSLVHKVQSILEFKRRAMSVKELAQFIFNYEKAVSLRDLSSNLSATLKQKVDKGELFQRAQSGEGYLYGLIEWFDDSGSIQEQYLF